MMFRQQRAANPPRFREQQAEAAPETAPEQDMAEAPPPELEQVGDSDVVVEQPAQADTYQQDAAIVISPRRPLTPAPQMKVTEVSSYGQLPRIGKG